jgi:tetratricopeptide (TPR) repeat protein
MIRCVHKFQSEMEMTPVLKAGLFIIAICLAASSTYAQQPGLGKPATKNTDAEVNDSLKQAAALFEAGQNAHQKGELEKAIEHYSEALKRDPSLWQAEFQRAAAYFSLNKLLEAKASVFRLLEQLKEFADSPELKQIYWRVQTMLGEIALAESRVSEAEAAFLRALELNPQAARARAGLAEVLLSGGKNSEAIAEAKAAIEAGDERAATYSLLGEAQALAGKYEEALLSLNESLKREPKNAIALRYRAEVYLAREDLKAAIADLRASAEIQAALPTLLRLAGVLARAKQYDEAISLYRRILQTESSNNEAQIALAAVMIESGKGAEAIAQLESLIKSEPSRVDLRAQLAELYLPSQPEKALEQYLAAAKLEPSRPSYQIGVAAALVKLKRFQEAAAAARQALAQNPKEDVAYFAHTNLATALFELDDFQNAAREFVWILDYQLGRRDQKRAAITLYFLGVCFDKLGDYEQALKAYNQFLAIASTDNQLEIDKVKLRLPSLQRQVKEGKGKRKQQ